MTLYEKIEVTSYSGYKGEESPRTFILAGKRIEVMKIMEQWIEETADRGERRRCFRVRGSDWKVHVLCFEEEKMEWTCRCSNS